VHLIVPFPPGGVTDTLARHLAQALKPNMVQPIIIDNKAGASQLIGAEAAAHAPPDGYTIFMGSSPSHVINPLLFAKLPYDAVRDFEPVVPVSDVQFVFVVHDSVPAKTLPEFIRYAKERPGLLSYASHGNAGTPHMSMELFKQVTGIDMLHIPFKGAAPAEQELASGRVQAMITPFSVFNFVKAGRVRILAITSAKRSPVIPDVPTVAELGYPGFEAKSWFGLFAPKGTPKEVVHKLNFAVNKALKEPDLVEALRKLGLEPTGGSSEQLASQIQSESVLWKRVIQRSGIKLD